MKASIEKFKRTSSKADKTQKPNFLIPGSGRAGSTFLHSCLKQHPEIFFSTIKEPSYFSKYYELGDEWYLQHFKSSKSHPIVGEASTQYFYTAKATKRIYEFNPDFKLVFMIRNPIIRAYSNYKREIQMWGESRLFEYVIKADTRYTWPAKFFTHLTRFLKYFPKSQLKVIIFEKFIKNIDNYLKEICQFLEIKSNFKFNHNKFVQNPSKMPISLNLQKVNKRFFELNRKEPFLIQTLRVGCRALINSINHAFYKSREFPEMKSSTKKYLRDYFLDEIIKLEDLINEDLSIWKNI